MKTIRLLILASLACIACSLHEESIAEAFEDKTMLKLKRAGTCGESGYQIDIIHNPISSQSQIADDAIESILQRSQQRPYDRGLETRRFTSSKKELTLQIDNSMADNEFLIRVGIGTPSQFFFATFDMGSADSWVYGPECCFANNHTHFDPNRSETFRDDTIKQTPGAAEDTAPKVDDSPTAESDDSQTLEPTDGTKVLQYDDLSSLQLRPATDTITFANDEGSPKLSNASVAGQIINIVTAAKGANRQKRLNEALIGFAPGNASVLNNPLLTPIESLIKAHALLRPLLSITLVKADRETGQGAGGRLTIGAIDQDAILGDITWVRSTAMTFWGTEFEEGAIRFGDVDIWDPDVVPRRVVVDSGAAIIFLPPASARMANEMIDGAYRHENSSRWVIPCSTGTQAYESDLPPERQTAIFSISFNGQHFAIPPEDLVLYPNQPIDDLLVDTNLKNYCLSSIQEGNDRFAVLGNTFIKNHMIVIDYGDDTLTQRRIGIAHRRDAGILIDDNFEVVRRISPQPP